VQFSIATSPGFLVNLVPSLRHIPAWVPGAGFKTTAKAWAATLDQMVEQPYQWVKQQLAAGTAEKSLLRDLLDGKDLTETEEFDVKWIAASLYSGGADTTVAAINAFFKAMVLFPEVQAKAQQEIDSVVGTDRLPGFADKDSLPYTTALALEVLRWHTVAPTGMPHRLTEDHIHNGYMLPKGSLVMTNIWKISHDERLYPDPWAFKPERFMGKETSLDPRDLAFGFGRRICPGRVLADASVWISVVMTLAAFDISKHPDGPLPDMDQAPGLVSHTSAFQCSIKPRSEKALDLIQGDVKM